MKHWLMNATASLLGGFVVLNLVLLCFMTGPEVMKFDQWLGSTAGKAVGLIPATARATAEGVGDAKSWSEKKAPKPSSKVLKP